MLSLPSERLVIATNENDILHRFWKSGRYEKKPVHGAAALGGIAEDGVKAHEDGVKETLSPAMDILVSSNFERLLWYLAYDVYSDTSDAIGHRRATAGDHVKDWLAALKTHGGFEVDKAILDRASEDFESERVSDEETLQTITGVYRWQSPATSETSASGTTGKGYILDPHSAIGIAAALRSVQRSPPPTTHHIALATAHPAKFSRAVDMALQGEKGYSFDTVLPAEFKGLEDKPRRVSKVKKSDGWEGVRRVVVAEVEAELAAAEQSS